MPYPKYDEAQKTYFCDTWEGSPAAFIPVTSADAEKAGLILDAMAYEGEKTAVPAFRDYAVEQKGLRNEDSIEMLAIATRNIIPVYYSIFGINSSIELDRRSGGNRRLDRNRIHFLEGRVLRDEDRRADSGDHGKVVWRLT